MSAVTNGFRTAQAQQRFAVDGRYTFNSAWDVSLTYSNVQYIPGINSSFHDLAIWNTGGAVLHWKATPTWDFGAGYSYTRATKSNGIESSAQYQQVNLSEYYSLSKRTGLYALQAYQRAHGQTLGNGRREQHHQRDGDGRRRLPDGAIVLGQHVRGRRGYHPPLLILAASQWKTGRLGVRFFSALPLVGRSYEFSGIAWNGA